MRAMTYTSGLIAMTLALGAGSARAAEGHLTAVATVSVRILDRTEDAQEILAANSARPAAPRATVGMAQVSVEVVHMLAPAAAAEATAQPTSQRMAVVIYE